jgi:hypothetical protein
MNQSAPICPYPDVDLRTVPRTMIASGCHWADETLSGLVSCRHLVRLTSRHGVKCMEPASPRTERSNLTFCLCLFPFSTPPACP